MTLVLKVGFVEKQFTPPSPIGLLSTIIFFHMGGAVTKLDIPGRGNRVVIEFKASLE